MMAVALMSSDNRAAAALGRTAFPGGTQEFVAAMNREAARLGMTNSQFADPTGLDAGNVSTAADLIKLVRAAAREPLIRGITSTREMQVQPYGDGGTLEYRNTNPLVKRDDWRIKVSKTG
jgi:D-alanyl-D-alanine endopeptidase (penicillin-binding protein 7)